MVLRNNDRIRFYFYFVLLFSSICLFYMKIFEPSFLPANWRWRLLILKYSRNISQADLSQDQCKNGFYPALHAITQTYRRCLSNEMRGRSLWNHLHHVVSYCLDDQLWKMLDIKILHNWGDTKLVILPTTDKPKLYQSEPGPAADVIDKDCVEVTLGIGTDIAAELHLRKLMPDCRFFGADPVYDSGAVFKQIGQYFQLAVAAKSGQMHSYVLENTIYRKRDLVGVSLVDFLKLHARVNHVDYFFLDIEGGEYDMLQELTGGGSLERSKIPICQISLELHVRSEWNDTAYHQLVNRLLWHSPFVPLWSSAMISETPDRVTMFYINAGDAYCVEKYFRQKVCNY